MLEVMLPYSLRQKDPCLCGRAQEKGNSKRYSMQDRPALAGLSLTLWVMPKTRLQAGLG